MGGKVLLTNASIQKPYDTWCCRKLKDNFFEENSFHVFYIFSLRVFCIRSLISRYMFICSSFVPCSCLTDVSNMVADTMILLLYWKNCSRIFYYKVINSHDFCFLKWFEICWEESSVKGETLCVCVCTNIYTPP